MASPTRSGGYRLLGLIGRGGTADVHAAVESRTGREVVIKLARDAATERTLFEEYAAACRVDHPNVVRAHEIVRFEDGRCGLVLDRVHGTPLGQLLPVDRDVALPLARGIVRAVAAVHASGLVHGDLSPENVLIERSREGLQPRLIDLSTVVGSEVRAAPGYVAPELLRGARPSRAADLYSVGCLIYDLLVGGRVFGDMDRSRLIDCHLHELPTFPDDLDPELRELLAELLAKHPDGRPDSAEHVMERLAQIAGEPVEPERVALGRTLLARGPLVGRDEVLERLRAGVGTLAKGRGTALLVIGETGAGRTELARWLRSEASRTGVLPVYIPDAGRDSLSDLGRDLGRSDESADADSVTDIAARLSIDAVERPRLVVVDRPDEDPSGARRTFECLTTAARLGPVMGVVFASPPARFGGDAKRVKLRRFGSTERRALVRSRLALDDGAVEAVASILDRAGVEQPREGLTVLDVLVEQQIVHRAAGRWCVDRSRIAQRGDACVAEASAWAARALIGLAPEVHGLLAAAAIAIGPMRAVDLAAMAGLAARDESWRPAIDALAARELIAPGPNATWRVAASAAADAARRACGEAFERRAHGVAADLGGTAIDSELRARRVWHRSRAGQPVDAASIADAANHWIADGRSARALALLDGVDRGRTAGRLGALDIARAHALAAQGDTAAARTLLETLLEVGRDADVVEALGTLLVSCGDHAAVRKLLEPCMQTPNERLAVARARMWMGDYDDADALALSLIDNPVAAPTTRGGAASVRSTCAWHRGDLAGAEAIAKAGLEWVGSGDRAISADLWRAVGTARIYRGDHAGAEVAIVRAAEENRVLGRVPELAKCLNNLGIVCYHAGRWEQAFGHWDEFRLLCARLGDSVEIANAANNLGFVTMRLGEFEQAARYFREAITTAEHGNYPRVIPVTRANLGEALAGLGRLAEAEREYDAAQPDLEALDASHDLVELARRRIELRLAQGDLEAAEAQLEALARDPRLDGLALEIAHIDRLRAACLRRRNDRVPMEEAARRAVEAFSRLDSPYEEACAREECARVLVTLRRPEDALRELASAKSIWMRLGARRDLDRLRGLEREIAGSVRGRDAEGTRGKILLDVAMQFGSTLDLSRLLPLVLARVVELLHADRGLFALCDRHGNVEDAVVHHLRWEGPGHPLPISRGLVDQVIRTGEVVAVQDVLDDTHFRRRRSVLLHGLRSMVGVPVFDESRVIGVIYVDSKISAEDDIDNARELLTALARMVGTAVANARLFEEQRFRAHLLAVMVHDLRSPLTAVQTNAMLLGADAWDARGEVGEIAADIDAGAQRALRMIDDTLELARIDAGAEPPEPQRIDLRELLDEFLDPLRTIGRAAGLNIEIHATQRLPRAYSVPARVIMILNNLVYNALKFAPRGSTVDILMRPRADVGPESARNRPPGEAVSLFRRVKALEPAEGCRYVEISVRNGGPPIPEELQRRMFLPFVSGAQSTQGCRRSTGLGLSIVEQCARNLGGCVWVSSGQAGTRFTFSLPTRVVE